MSIIWDCVVLVDEQNHRLGQIMKFDVIFEEIAVVQHNERLNALYIDPYKLNEETL